MSRSLLAFAALLAAGCITEADVSDALRKAEQGGAVATTTCGFETSGLSDVHIENLHVSESSGTATVTGVALDGPKKGTKCTGEITFDYVKGRSVTQGVNGQSETYVAVIQNVARK